jgi:hypothetical protein
VFVWNPRHIRHYTVCQIKLTSSEIINIERMQKYFFHGSINGKEVCLVVNPEKTKYTLMSRKKAGQKPSINRYFERVARLKSLGTTLLHAGRD